MKKYDFFVLFLAISLYSSTIYVKWDAVNNDGTSWATAFADLQSALNTAVSGDEIWVAAGTYKPTWDYGLGGARYYHFRLKNGVAIYGGFNGSETLLSERNIELYETILSGDIGIEIDNRDNCYHIIYNVAELFIDETAIIDGFTFSSGTAYKSYDYFYSNGGAICNISASPTIRNCFFKDNNAITYGGAIFNDNSSPVLIQCKFKHNSVANGGGVSNINSSPFFLNCLIYHNSATYGGGIYEESSNTVYSNCTISENTGPLGGGFYGYSSNTTFNNSIVWGNNGFTSGYQFYNNNNCHVVLNYSCYSNEVNDITNILSSTFTATNNCLTSDPLFSDAMSYDFTLFEGSPCIDSGNNGYNLESYDLAGNARIINVTIDMGAYEFSFLSQPEITIYYDEAGTIFVNWDPVAGATSYKVYESDDPYQGFLLAGTYGSNEHQHLVSDNKKFFYVVASTEAVKK